MDPRQKKLNKFRRLLKLSEFILTDDDKLPFTESLRERSREHNENFHVEFKYDTFVTIYMTWCDDMVVVNGDIANINKLEEDAAQQLGCKK